MTDLTIEDVRLFEDGTPQRVAVLEAPGAGRQTPLEVILLLDVSLSVMNHNLLNSFSIRETILEGLDEFAGVSIYAFAQRLKRFCRPTRDPEKLETALKSAYGYAHGGTRLYEAIMRTCQDAAESGGAATRLMVVLSDGFSTTSTPPEQALAAARHFGITLYPVILGHDRVLQQAASAGGMHAPSRHNQPWGPTPPPGVGPARGGGYGMRDAMQRNRESRARWLEWRMAAFAALGDATGGRSFDPPEVSNGIVGRILLAVTQAARAEYVAGYYPAAGDGAPRARVVSVQLVGKGKGKIQGGRRLVVR